MKKEEKFSVILERQNNYQFETHFDWETVKPIVMDEPEPLGTRSGANGVRILASAVGYCLSASLLFCLEKSRIAVGDLKTTVEGELYRNQNGRLRVRTLNANMIISLSEEQKERAERCLSLFEDYCTVTASVRQAIEVIVTIIHKESGQALYLSSGMHAGSLVMA